MRAAFVAAEALPSAADAATTLGRLEAAGLQPVVLVDRAEVDPLPGSYPTVVWPPPGTGEETAETLVRAAAEANAALSESFLVGVDAQELTQAIASGCRPVLVLGDRTLSQVFGPEEPEHKEFAVAPSLDIAVDYMLEEVNQEAMLGPFPYAPHRPLEERQARVDLTSGDLVRVLVVVIAAGVAIALGIAYLLQEIYQTYHFPPIAYYITLQFIPQTWRGILFLLIGAAGTLLAQHLLRTTFGRRTK